MTLEKWEWILFMSIPTQYPAYSRYSKNYAIWILNHKIFNMFGLNISWSLGLKLDVLFYIFL